MGQATGKVKARPRKAAAPVSVRGQSPQGLAHQQQASDDAATAIIAGAVVASSS